MFDYLHLQEGKKAQVVDWVLWLGEVNWATIILNFGFQFLPTTCDDTPNTFHV
jgi:hypothetical protein